MAIGKRRRNLFLFATLLLVAACGGGGSSGPSNHAPAFTSAAAASVAENSTGVVYTAMARDSDGDPLTYSLTGGPDATLFQLSGNQISFVTPPDFEAPADADHDNVYRFQISVSDGAVTTPLDVSITVTNVGPDTYHVSRVGTGFVEPTFTIGLPDGSGRMLVLERAGLIRVLDPATGAVLPTPFLDVRNRVSTVGDGAGLLSLAFSPDTSGQRGVYYIYLVNTAGDIEVRQERTALSGSAILPTSDPTADKIVLTIPHAGINVNYGGSLAFDSTGALFIGTGDDGTGFTSTNAAQNRSSLLGKILKINPAGDDFPADPSKNYAIVLSPSDGEVYALGLRNPYRMTIYKDTLFIGDIGQDRKEEIDTVGTTARPDFGWPIMEGSLTGASASVHPFLTPPTYEYDHGTGPIQGKAVVGGYVYDGPIETLRGRYIFGDFVNPRIWSFAGGPGVDATSATATFTDLTTLFRPNAGSIDHISSFGQDEAKNLYIVDYDGEIFRVVAG